MGADKDAVVVGRQISQRGQVDIGGVQAVRRLLGIVLALGGDDRRGGGADVNDNPRYGMIVPGVYLVHIGAVGVDELVVQDAPGRRDLAGRGSVKHLGPKSPDGRSRRVVRGFEYIPVAHLGVEVALRDLALGILEQRHDLVGPVRYAVMLGAALAFLEARVRRPHILDHGISAGGDQRNIPVREHPAPEGHAFCDVRDGHGIVLLALGRPKYSRRFDRRDLRPAGLVAPRYRSVNGTKYRLGFGDRDLFFGHHSYLSSERASGMLMMLSCAV